MIIISLGIPLASIKIKLLFILQRITALELFFLSSIEEEDALRELKDLLLIMDFIDNSPNLNSETI